MAPDPVDPVDPVDRVDAAFAAVPREGFLRPALRRRASLDHALPIGHGQTNSQPRTVADMLRLLEVLPGHRVLDVGSGSGWTTALLAHLTGPTGLVRGVEVVADLVAWGTANVSATGMPWATIQRAAEGVLGWPADAPYDRILVSADGGRLPDELVEQLCDGGRMVIPVAGRMLVVERDGDEVHRTPHGHYRFVPLV
jgi:protein-L-isoaspartate(D-aspartate) O-methyltransferase